MYTEQKRFITYIVPKSFTPKQYLKKANALL